MKRRLTYGQKSRIAWRRGQWADVDAFLRGEHRKRAVGPGMAEPEDGTSAACEVSPGYGTRQVPMLPRLDQLEGRRGS